MIYLNDIGDAVTLCYMYKYHYYHCLSYLQTLSILIIMISVLAVELAKELEEYGLKCSVPKSEDEAANEADSDSISSEVCIIFTPPYKHTPEKNIEIQ